jgi:ABC-2 type transport system permease protein
VDQAGVIQTLPESIPAGLFRPLASTQAAESALARGEIDAYFIIPAGYRETGRVQRVSQQLSINTPDVGWFDRLLAANLLPDASPDQIDRLRRPLPPSGPEFVSVSPADPSGGQSSPMASFVVALAIIMPLFTSAGYLFQSMSQEKGSRVMEILLLSVRPRQLLTGKLLGLGLLTVVQYSFWLGFGGLALFITGREPGLLLAGAGQAANQLVWIGPFALGGFLLYAALMAGIGALARDVEDGRSWLFIISLPLMIPIYLWMVIASEPDGPVAVVLSLIPFSAPVAMLMRLASGPVPAWQLATSLALLAVTVVATIWLMARLFQVRTLLSGEPISARRMWATLKET